MEGQNIKLHSKLREDNIKYWTGFNAEESAKLERDIRKWREVVWMFIVSHQRPPYVME